jgi:hypothetical protein
MVGAKLHTMQYPWQFKTVVQRAGEQRKKRKTRAESRLGRSHRPLDHEELIKNSGKSEFRGKAAGTELEIRRER